MLLVCWMLSFLLDHGYILSGRVTSNSYCLGGKQYLQHALSLQHGSPHCFSLFRTRVPTVSPKRSFIKAFGFGGCNG